jgi:hypothetical protein
MSPPKDPPPKQSPPEKKKMLILRGNSADAGTYPDEQGNTNIAWPFGALHVWAAREYARRKGYEPVVLDIPGQPQSETSPQASEALNRFLHDTSFKAFYGFSGGGYNLWFILRSLAKNQPETLERIEMVVVLGAPKKPPSDYASSTINDIAKKEMAKKHIDLTNWKPGPWGPPIYRTNPEPSALPKYVPKGTDPHMFGPEALLSDVEPEILVHNLAKEDRESRVRYSPVRTRGHH